MVPNLMEGADKPRAEAGLSGAWLLIVVGTQAAVFPLGMYNACTRRLVRVFGLPFLGPIPSFTSSRARLG